MSKENSPLRQAFVAAVKAKGLEVPVFFKVGYSGGRGQRRIIRLYWDKRSYGWAYDEQAKSHDLYNPNGTPRAFGQARRRTDEEVAAELAEKYAKALQATQAAKAELQAEKDKQAASLARFKAKAKAALEATGLAHLPACVVIGPLTLACEGMTPEGKIRLYCDVELTPHELMHLTGAKLEGSREP